jgi:hypothetical protein
VTLYHFNARPCRFRTFAALQPYWRATGQVAEDPQSQGIWLSVDAAQAYSTFVEIAFHWTCREVPRLWN